MRISIRRLTSLLVSASCLVLFALPLASATADGCPQLQNSQNKTVVYGDLTVNGQNVSPGSLLLARSPRGDIVGCQLIETAGTYGLIYVYGQETTPTGETIPGMRSGEAVTYAIDGVTATANPALLWANDWQSSSPHEIDLSATFLSPPVAVANPLLQYSGGALDLGWLDVGGTVHHYQVWRGSTPYFTPGQPGASQVGSDIPTPHMSGAPLGATNLPHNLGDASQNDYFLVVAVDTVGQVSTVSQRVGAFDFNLTPGVP